MSDREDFTGSTGRNETREEQLDRNWAELLQELRMLQTGVQILAGFLLTLPFQQRFADLDNFQVGLYLVNVVIATLTTAFILLPVSVHRRLFRQRLKETLVSSADTITKIALAGVGMLSVGTAALVFDVTAGRTAGLTAGGILLAALLVLLVYVPLRLNKRAAEQ
ncbi:tellurite resistance protein TehA-like permease [Arthrobacter sp. UYNi723]